MTADEKKKPPFFLSSYRKTQENQEKGREFELVDDAGNRTGVFFTIHGSSSSRYRMGLEELRAKQLREQRISEPTHEQMTADAAQVWSWCISGWRTGDEAGVVYIEEGDPPVPFSRENAEKVLLLSDFIRGQVKVRGESGAGFIDA